MMNVEIYCIGEDGQVLGATTVQAEGESGKLLAPGPVDVPIVVHGVVARVSLRIPEADWQKDTAFPFRIQRSPGQTVRCDFEDRVMVTLA